MENQSERMLVKVKTPKSQVSVRLPVVDVAERPDGHRSSTGDIGISDPLPWDSSLLSFHRVPRELSQTALCTLQALTEENPGVQVDHQSIAEARLQLQAWFQGIVQALLLQHSNKQNDGSEIFAAPKKTRDNDNRLVCQHPYLLRHIIPRRSKSSSSTAERGKQQPPNERKERIQDTTTSEDGIASAPKEERKNSIDRRSFPKSSFAIQSPVSRFHTDSTHTAFVNLWLPMARVQNDPLGFLYHWPTKQLLTATLLEDLLSQPNCEKMTTTTPTSSSSPTFSKPDLWHQQDPIISGDDSTAPSSSVPRDPPPSRGEVVHTRSRQVRMLLESTCCILYASSMTLGDAWIFRSGGLDGIFHGSIHFPDSEPTETRAGRRSVEFRCQPYDYGRNQWVYGEPTTAATGASN